jgi:hypothetical protein
LDLTGMSESIQLPIHTSSVFIAEQRTKLKECSQH